MTEAPRDEPPAAAGGGSISAHPPAPLGQIYRFPTSPPRAALSSVDNSIRERPPLTSAYRIGPGRRNEDLDPPRAGAPSGRYNPDMPKSPLSPTPPWTPATTVKQASCFGDRSRLEWQPGPSGPLVERYSCLLTSDVAASARSMVSATVCVQALVETASTLRRARRWPPGVTLWGVSGDRPRMHR